MFPRNYFKVTDNGSLWITPHEGIVMYPDFDLHIGPPLSTWNGKYGDGWVIAVNFDRDGGMWIIPGRGTDNDNIEKHLSNFREWLGDSQFEKLEIFLREKNLIP
jgi:ligand-binding sensor domain-containing protein